MRAERTEEKEEEEMCRQFHDDDTERAIERDLKKRIGVYSGQVVTVVSDWMDANREKHYVVRLPDGNIIQNVPQDEISFDRKLILAKSSH